MTRTKHFSCQFSIVWRTKAFSKFRRVNRQTKLRTIYYFVESIAIPGFICTIHKTNQFTYPSCVYTLALCIFCFAQWVELITCLIKSYWKIKGSIQFESNLLQSQLQWFWFIKSYLSIYTLICAFEPEELFDIFN